MSELAKVKRKIHALLQKTTENGCTEDEALAAAHKAGELMDFYNLSITDVQIRDTECIKDFVESTSKRRDGMDQAIVGIARYCDVKTWFSPGTRYSKARYYFFGLEPDVMLAKHLVTVVKQALATSLEEFKNSDYYVNVLEYEERGARRSATVSFQHGFSRRICDRLYEMKSDRDKNIEKEQRTGRDLVLVKQQKVEEEFQKNGPRLRKVKVSQGGSDFGGALAGSKAANSVNLNNPVGQTRGRLPNYT